MYAGHISPKTPKDCKSSEICGGMTAMNNPSIDLDQLATKVCNLESGHPIEQVLATHGIPEGMSAYEVIRYYDHALRFAARAVTTDWRKRCQSRAAKIEPAVMAIHNYFQDNP
jgi:hypothetical protein